jgi:sterol desaturase/sphingolipid hydroxylase (fatty acid hydroxylase superfamily)
MTGVAAIALSGLAGAATWTLLEYAIHRYLGHGRRWRKNPFALEHIRHHVEGDYFAPTWKKVVIAGGVGAVASAGAVAAVGAALGLGYVAGLLACYALYEWVHRRDHTHAGWGAYGRWLRAHHFRHHLEDARKNFGVTTPLWDLVFGTYATGGIISVPPRLAMRWLVDPARGTVRAEHADRFVLRGKR